VNGVERGVARILILGGSGMLGSMVADVLSRNPGFRVKATVRTDALQASMAARMPEAEWCVAATLDEILAAIDDHDWVVNAIGITKPLIRDDVSSEIERAIEVNAFWPHQIGRRAARVGARVLQIATDAVYSGATGFYTETAVHDALDVYGKTKSLGEAHIESMHHLRCSIIGLESRNRRFLIEWFRQQPAGAEVRGFINHLWNGVTTLHFARACQGVITTNLSLPHLLHVVPSGTITKAQMLHCFADVFERTDIRISDVDSSHVVNRTLSTARADLNASLWRAAGYSVPPTVPQMIGELAAFEYRG
jgi:dTDP-4-dehydrorhamnose reductase